LREYLDDVYIKIVDIWGFITAYYPLLEMFSNNYFTLDNNEMKILKQLQHIFNKYLYTPRHNPIDIDELLGDFKILENLLHTVAHGKRKTTSSGSLASGIKKRNTHKNRRTSIFKKKPKQRRFKNPFFLSLK
jgi:hypothetical protein